VGDEESRGSLAAMIGSTAQDYLKTIYKLRDSDGLVSPSLVAERLAVSPPAVTKMVRRLVELNLVRIERGQRIALTPAGEKIALEVIRHHRLLELYLKEALGYSWDQVDAEAERLEHHISEDFEDRIDALLGYPTHDPHGDPIPTRDGVLPADSHHRLTSLEPGEEAVIRRVRDGDPELLRYIGSLGLFPDTAIQMVRKEPFGGPLRVRVGGRECAIGREVGDSVFVDLVSTGDEPVHRKEATDVGSGSA